MKKLCIGFLLILSCLSCSCSVFDNEITQYIVVKADHKLQPVAKVTYKVFVDRQEIIYWVDIPGVERSQLYKMKNCKIVDIDNWEGEPDDLSYPLTDKVECINGKFTNENNVGWWTWYFETNPRPKPSKFVSIIEIIVGIIVGILVVIGLISGIQEEIEKMKKKKHSKDVNGSSLSS